MFWGTFARATQGDTHYYRCEPEVYTDELRAFHLGLELSISDGENVKFYVGNLRLLGSGHRLNWDGIRGYLAHVIFWGQSMDEIQSFFQSPVEIDPSLFRGESGSVYLEREKVVYEFFCSPQTKLLPEVIFSF